MKWINAGKELPIKGDINSLQNVIVKFVGGKLAISNFIEYYDNSNFSLERFEWLKEYSEKEIDEMQDKWVAYTKHSPLTRTQHDFMRFLLEYQDKFNMIGDLTSIFEDVVRFSKNR